MSSADLSCGTVLGVDGGRPVVVTDRSVRTWSAELGASVITPLPSPPPAGDCVVGLSGSWFVTASGRVGTIGRYGGALLRLDELHVEVAPVRDRQRIARKE